MGFVSFLGRALFAAVFLLSAYQEFNEFGADGGPAAKALQPKFNVFVNNVSSHLGVAVPQIELKHVIAATIGLKGLGGLLFILSSSFGAYLLSNAGSRDAKRDPQNPTSSSFFRGTKRVPAKNELYAEFAGIPLASKWQDHMCSGGLIKLLHLAFVTPIVYDFYNYDTEKAEFAQLFGKFIENVALLGALLFFLGMKNSIPKRQAKKKAPKSKTN
ncbi:hypothetical protein ACP70R_013020 [Stipagrostis hirtigluma subsp. patula]